LLYIMLYTVYNELK